MIAKHDLEHTGGVCIFIFYLAASTLIAKKPVATIIFQLDSPQKALEDVEDTVITRLSSLMVSLRFKHLAHQSLKTESPPLQSNHTPFWHQF